ncbi:hypothetical protein [Aquimarina sp. SS2-1]|uniref:hypothetical protein n=1 Tax=Aquimarina besae TaxID=3342247 RepID=UPI00366FE68C
MQVLIKISYILFLSAFFLFLGCSQKSKKIEVSYREKEANLEFLFDNTDLSSYKDSIPVRIIIRKALALKRSQTHNVPKDVMFSIDTLFGQTASKGIGYAVLPYKNDKRIRFRKFKFETNEFYDFEFKIIYNTMISFQQKKDIIKNSTEQESEGEYDQALYLLNNLKENKNLINKIIPDSLKGDIAFNIVNKEKEHQFYQYKKIDF